VLENSLKALSVHDVKQAIKEAVLILDTRPASSFVNGFIPGSVFIGLEGRFAEWAGSLLPFSQRLLLVSDPGTEKEAVIRLARVGFNNVTGYLKGGFETWKSAREDTDMLVEIEADELAMDIPFDDNLVVLDVRKPTEFADGHVKDALNIPLEEMTDLINISSFDENQNIYVHCQGGYRSVIASSLLKRQGLHNLRNIAGGWTKINEQSKIKKEKEKSVLN
jgi:rhodanese-related sulfurtransferase